MFGGLFNGPNGSNLSSRRFIAFLYAIAGIASGCYCIYNHAQDWKVISASFGIPALVCIVLLLFTTWNDITSTIDAVKGNRNVTVSKED